MNELTFKELESIEGYLGYEAFRDENGFGVNVSYWKDMEALKNWRDNTLHQKAEKRKHLHRVNYNFQTFDSPKEFLLKNY